MNADEKHEQTMEFLSILHILEKAAEDIDIPEMREIVISARLRYRDYLKRIDFE